MSVVVPKNRTKLNCLLRESVIVAREATRRKLAVEEIAEERQERRITRRNFLGKTAAAAGLTLFHPERGHAANSRIVVVGAGLAGLRFAHAMWPT